MSTLADRVDAQKERLAVACQRAGRSVDDVTLVAVSKTHPVERVLEAQALGLRHFGESYAPEFREKAGAVDDVVWHFIGHLQSNKTAMVAPSADLVHSVDRAKIVRALASRVPEGRALDLLVQVNVSGEASKSGCAPEAAAALIDMIRATPNVTCVGLMTMAPFGTAPEEARPTFLALRRLRDLQRERLFAEDGAAAEALRHLSMGMSGDVEVAIEEGATLVRIGTAIFGPRTTV